MLVPLALLIIIFAVANRQPVTVSFDPFGAGDPALSATLPLYILIFILVILGVIVGGLAAWLRVPPERIRVLPFGTDCEFWRNTAPPATLGTRVVSVGSDSGRDYGTLLAAAADLPLHVVTRQPLPLHRYPDLV